MNGKQVRAVTLCLGCAILGMLNLISAAAYGEVFLTHGGTSWTSAAEDSITFGLSLVMSLVCFFGLGGLGVLMIRWSWQERRSARKRRSE